MTVYAFAIENFNRPKDEVDTIMNLAEKRLVEMAQYGYVCLFFYSVSFVDASWQSEILDRHGVRLNVLGRRELLPPSVQAAIEKAENMTRHNNACVCFLRVLTTISDVTERSSMCVHPTRHKTRSRPPSRVSFKKR